MPSDGHGPVRSGSFRFDPVRSGSVRGVTAPPLSQSYADTQTRTSYDERQRAVRRPTATPPPLSPAPSELQPRSTLRQHGARAAMPARWPPVCPNMHSPASTPGQSWVTDSRGYPNRPRNPRSILADQRDPSQLGTVSG